MNTIEKLYDCARLRGIQPQLIHRTIHEFNYWVTQLIFHYKENELIKPYREKIYNSKREDCLEEYVDLFHDFCLEIYNDDEKLTEWVNNAK